MLKNSILSRITSFLGLKKKSITFSHFRDSLGNFELFYPSGWKFDEDIAVIDGKYTISFDAKDGLSTFTISIDGSLPPKFNFASYAKTQLESPTSGIYTSIKRGKFKGMAAYTREYTYISSGRTYFGGGVMFFTGEIVGSISWSAPQNERETFEGIFRHMLDSLTVREGFLVKRRKKIVQGKIIEMGIMKGIKET